MHPTTPRLHDAVDVAAHVRDLTLLSHEVLAILGLDRNGRLLCDLRLAGNAHRVSATPADFLPALLRHDVRAFVLAHNHPSGLLVPSGADLRWTARVQSAARICGLRLVDHVIVAGGRWLSLRDAGWLVENGAEGA